MAWTAPVVLTSVTVPAFAASVPCTASKDALQQTSAVVNKVVFAGSTITADLSYRAVDRDGDLLSDQTPQQTGQIHRTPYDDPPDNPAWDYIKLHHPRLVAEAT